MGIPMPLSLIQHRSNQRNLKVRGQSTNGHIHVCICICTELIKQCNVTYISYGVVKQTNKRVHIIQIYVFCAMIMSTINASLNVLIAFFECVFISTD